MVLELDRSKLWDVFLFLRIKITVWKIRGMGRRTMKGAITAYKNDMAGLNETAGGYNVPKVTWKRRSDDKKDIRVMAKMEFEKQKKLASVETVVAATFQKGNRLWYRIVRVNRRMKRMKIAFVLFASLESVVAEEWIHCKKWLHLSCTSNDWSFLQTHISFQSYFLSSLGYKYFFFKYKVLIQNKGKQAWSNLGYRLPRSDRWRYFENIFFQLAI